MAGELRRATRHHPLVVAVVLGVCASSPSAVGQVSTLEGSPQDQGVGCSAPVVPGSHTLTLSVNGHARTVIVHLPPGYGGHALPLVLNMHGSGATALGQERFTGMDATADADGFIVAYPQGAIQAGSGFEWNVPHVPLPGGAAVPAGAADDVSFLAEVVTTLEHRYCVEPARIFATGFSGGGRMASQLACDASAIFAAVAPVSGLRMPSPCRGARPVSVLSFHGTADRVDPYDGHGQAYWTDSVPRAAQEWAAQNGCHATPTTSEPAHGVVLTTYDACLKASAVELYTLAGEGHRWPGGPPIAAALAQLLGPEVATISADATMWRFFAAHPFPSARAAAASSHTTDSGGER
jgi:polyhydroxybutyrate depolymerase